MLVKIQKKNTSIIELQKKKMLWINLNFGQM